MANTLSSDACSALIEYWAKEYERLFGPSGSVEGLTSEQQIPLEEMSKYISCYKKWYESAPNGSETLAKVALLKRIADAWQLNVDTINKLIKYMESTLAALTIMVLCGCQSGLYKVSTTEDASLGNVTVRYYEIAGSDNTPTRFMKENGMSQDGILYDEDKMPIQIIEGRSDRTPDKPGWSGVLWMFSVGIFPMCYSEYMTQDITVKSPIGERSGSYRIDAKRWAGWIPLFVGYPGSADERDSDARLPNRRIENLGRERLVKALASEFSQKEYVAFAKKENANRKREIERVLATEKKIGDLLKENKYADAEALFADASKKQLGALAQDKKDWDAMKTLIADKKEDYRVANKKSDLERKFGESKYEEVVAACDQEDKGATRHAGIWSELRQKAETAISERDRKQELARIDKKKDEVVQLLAGKKYTEVIVACDQENCSNAGSRPEDAAIWRELRLKAQTAKSKIDRAAEEERIASKLAKVKKLLDEKKFSEVVSLCEEENGQNPGSRPDDLSQWRSLRARALANDLLSNADERSKTTFCLKGFYLGMTLDEAEILLDYYFPKFHHERLDEEILIDSHKMPFCESKGGRVTCLTFDKKMLECWFEYDYQTYHDWAVEFAKEFSLDLRAGSLRDKKAVKGFISEPPRTVATIRVSQDTYSYVNRKLRYKIIYFGDLEREDGEEIIRGCTKETVGEYVSIDAEIARYREWWTEYISHKGAEEGTLRIEKLTD